MKKMKYISPEVEVVLVNIEEVFCSSRYNLDNQICPWESEDDDLLLFGKEK